MTVLLYTANAWMLNKFVIISMNHDTKVALLKLSTVNLYHSHGCDKNAM